MLVAEQMDCCMSSTTHATDTLVETATMSINTAATMSVDTAATMSLDTAASSETSHYRRIQTDFAYVNDFANFAQSDPLIGMGC